MRIKLAYYSGTGGTQRIATCFAQEFSAKGNDVSVERIQLGNDHHDSLSDYDLLVLVSVTHDFNAPHQVLLWLESLDETLRLDAAVIFVSGGGEAITNRAARQAAIKILESKGARVFFEDMFPMPVNYFYRVKHPIDAMEMEAYPYMVKKRAAAILAREQRRIKPPAIDRFITWMCRNAWQGGAAFGRSIQVSDTCTGCGLCAEGCPSKNISLDSASSKPVFSDTCARCLHCLYVCPNTSLVPGKERYAVLKGGYDLDEIASRRASASEWENLDRIAPGWLWGGIRPYLQEAWELIKQQR
ncbi:MAG: hypothetical protein HGA54_06555 [Actinobacteria bacterium]|nr:hypothetical protein [Actinomycetota bacterium]